MNPFIAIKSPFTLEVLITNFWILFFFFFLFLLFSFPITRFFGMDSISKNHLFHLLLVFMMSTISDQNPIMTKKINRVMIRAERLIVIRNCTIYSIPPVPFPRSCRRWKLIAFALTCMVIGSPLFGNVTPCSFTATPLILEPGDINNVA